MNVSRPGWTRPEIVLVLFTVPPIVGLTGAYLLWRDAGRSLDGWPGLETVLTLLLGGVVVVLLGLRSRRDRPGTAGLAVATVVSTGLVVAGFCAVATVWCSFASLSVNAGQ